MDVTPYGKHAGWFAAYLLALPSLLLIGSAAGAQPQGQPVSSPTVIRTAEPALSNPTIKQGTEGTTIVDSAVQQVSCPSCGAGLLSGGGGGHGHSAGCASCGSCGWNSDCNAGECGCGGPCCRPGGHCCHPCTSDNWLCKCWCRFYNCICCPDPCYDAQWVAAADSGFFIDAARPVTQFKFRYDGLRGMDFPDRAEYFWARTGGGGKGPGLAERRLDSNDLYLITEVGAGKAGVVVEVPYRHVVPEVNGSDAGWADIRIAVKSLLIDCELMQFTFQMKTYIPSGKFTTGLGTGHTALEPAVLCTSKLTPRVYLQTMIAEWIPIGGDQEFQGSILHYHFSLNSVLLRPAPELQLIGTLEMGGWHFQGGQFSDPAAVVGDDLVPQPAIHDAFYSFGGGVRFVMCDKMDLGLGAVFGTGTDDRLIFDKLYRVEFRYRF